MSRFRFDDFKRIFLPLLALFLLCLWLMPRAAKFNYDYRKGTAWEYDDLVAEFDFPILKSDAEVQSERLRPDGDVVPYFTCDIFEEQARIDSIVNAWPAMLPLRERYLTLLEQVYENGVVADGTFDGRPGGVPSVVYVERNKRRSEAGVETARSPMKVASGNILTASQASRYIFRRLSATSHDLRVDSLFQRAGMDSRVVPNLHYDAVMTELTASEQSKVESPTLGVVHFGDRIVRRGELITDDLVRVLDSYRSEFESRMGALGAGGLEWLGHGIIALALVLLFYVSVLYTNPRILKESNRFLYLCIIFALSTVVTFVVESLMPRNLYFVPFTLTTLYLVAFFKWRVVLPVYVVSLLPLLLFAHGGLTLFFIFLVGGAVTMYVFKYFNRGWQQFLTALIAFLAEALVYIGFHLFGGDSSDSMPAVLLMLFIGSFLSVAGYPLIYLFEILFNLVSGSRLMELCDTNNRLLRELSEKAPGTFQHSLQVMNMADAACREIGGNVLLVRAGALYHDIGKMRNPRCFIENEGQFAGMPPYHDGLSPHDSAVQIVRHVPDGIELAEKHHLPEIVKEFIRTHHGTACARYFYTQYLNAGGSPDNAADFFYDGKKPYTKEQTVLMLCDSIEAASRTMKEYTPQACGELVAKIINGKQTEGQLQDSELSIRELDTLQNFLKTYLSQMYHARIEYPKLNAQKSRNRKTNNNSNK